MKRIRIVAAILAVVVAMGLAFVFLSKNEKQEMQNKTQVVVAIVNIPEYTKVTEDMVKSVMLDKDAVNPQAETTIEGVLGKTTTSLIMKEEQILSSRLISEDGTNGGNDFAYKIRDGYRAYSLNVVMDAGVSYLIQPGSHVDVVTVYERILDKAPEIIPEGGVTPIEVIGEMYKNEEDEEENEEYVERVAEFLLQNVNVLSIDSHYKNSTTQEEIYEYVTVVLELSPEDVLTLNLADRNRNLGGGELRLVLRENGDEVIVDIEPISVEVY